MRKPCCDKQDTNKGAWSKQEDQKLINYIRIHGEGCWSSIPQAAGLLRCGKSCRLRWINYLRPDLKRGNFGEDEEDLIIKLHALLGNRWSLIAGRLPGRTDNEVKNYWNSHLRRKLISMGIDPNNHKLKNHNVPNLTQFSPQSTASVTLSSSGSRTQKACKQLCRNYSNHNHAAETDQVSDTASCLDDNTSAAVLPDLNLKLTVSMPSPNSIPAEKKQQQYQDYLKMQKNGIENTSSSPTVLLLFH